MSLVRVAASALAELARGTRPLSSGSRPSSRCVDGVEGKSSGSPSPKAGYIFTEEEDIDSRRDGVCGSGLSGAGKGDGIGISS